MNATVSRFYDSIQDVEGYSDAGRVDAFVYYLTEELGQTAATVKQIEQCFRDCHLRVPKSVAPHLSRGLSTKPPKFIKVDGGYRLERHNREFIKDTLGALTHTAPLPKELRALEGKIAAGAEHDWLKEALDCYSVGAYRATLVMFWLFALDHLFRYILVHKLAEFNAALANHPDQKAVKKVGVVAVRDDFTNIGEEMFIDLCRTAKIIPPDVKRILGTTLGTRNSAAHPSGITISGPKVAVIAEDLVLNVVLKYPI